MAEFLIRRSIRALVTMFVVISLVFFATRLSGNFLDFFAPNQLNDLAKAELTRYFGLDESNWNQYLKYMGGKASETEEVDEFAEFEEQQGQENNN